MRDYYVVGPYQLGSKTGKSWVVGIPAEVVKELQINSSTIFALRIQKVIRSISLQMINEIIEKYECTIPEKSLPTSAGVIDNSIGDT